MEKAKKAGKAPCRIPPHTAARENSDVTDDFARAVKNAPYAPGAGRICHAAQKNGSGAGLLRHEENASYASGAGRICHAAATKKGSGTKAAGIPNKTDAAKNTAAVSFSLLLDGVTVPVTLTRRTGMKRMNIRFRPDGSLAVSAPPQIGRAYVGEYLRQNAARMLEHRRAAAQRQVSYARLSAAPEGGIRFFGEPVSVRVTAAVGRENVWYEGDFLLVAQKDPSDLLRRGKLLDRFQEETVLREMMTHCRELFPFLVAYQRQMTDDQPKPLPDRAKYGSNNASKRLSSSAAVNGGRTKNAPLSFPDIRLEHARSVWGTCASQKGVIRFSTALLGASHAFCRYVAAHELCHLLHPDHSPAFWRAVSALCPDWKALRSSAPTIL